MHSIPFTAPHVIVTHGVLQSPEWWIWLAYLIVLPMAYALMPGQLRESVKALWAPVGAFLSRLSCLWLWGRYFVWSALGGAFLLHFAGFPPSNPPDDNEPTRPVHPLRLAFRGFG